jgi:hypothetical protein
MLLCVFQLRERGEEKNEPRRSIQLIVKAYEIKIVLKTVNKLLLTC